ncbi:NADH-ubiquinone oxidoreductase chain C [hydrothermal vent metagenome]|uniref:NADH-ubiquinone oxidoreductase chain C n=1 Tax=hydrothermal vent metagenome TaxID=652676 RepID=A0A3B1CW77_9ZZZZ
MTSNEVIEKIKSLVGDDIQEGQVHLGDAVVKVAPDSFQKVAKILKEDADLNFEYLSDIRGVDYLDQDREPRFEAVYELHSFEHNHSVRVRVGLEEENPSVPTVSDLWKGALYPERELFDMFGFDVPGHPDLRRIIMPDEWEGNPLRKDYPLTIEDVAFSHNREYKSELVKSKPPTR